MALPMPPGRLPIRFIMKREISCPMMRKKKMGSTQLTRMERMGLAWVGMVAVNVISGSSRSWLSSR